MTTPEDDTYNRLKRVPFEQVCVNLTIEQEFHNPDNCRKVVEVHPGQGWTDEEYLEECKRRAEQFRSQNKE